MKLLILSDSHGKVEPMLRAAEQSLPDQILHLGDCWRDAEALHELLTDIPLTQVPGNCDLRPGAPSELVLCLLDKRILLCHGHTYGVKQSLLRAALAAQEQSIDLFLFGHTHLAFRELRGRTLFLNPGSIGDYARPTYAVAELVAGMPVRAKIFRPDQP